jgi:hypothetical protein
VADNPSQQGDGITRLCFEILNQSSTACLKRAPLDSLVARPREVAHDLRWGPRPRRSAAQRIELVCRPPASSSSKIVTYLIIHHANQTSMIPTCGAVVAAAVNLRQPCPIPCCRGDAGVLARLVVLVADGLRGATSAPVCPHRRAATPVSAALLAGALGGGATRPGAPGRAPGRPHQRPRPFRGEPLASSPRALSLRTRRTPLQSDEPVPIAVHRAHRPPLDSVSSSQSDAVNDHDGEKENKRRLRSLRYAHPEMLLHDLLLIISFGNFSDFCSITYRD